MVAFDFVEDFESDGILIDEGSYLVFEFGVLLLILLQLFFQFLQDHEVAMLHLLSLHLLLIDLFLENSDLLLQGFDLVLLSGYQLRLGVQVIWLGHGLLFRQSLFELRS